MNFIVIRNLDDPSIFQLYMHLSQSSIPDELKSVGAPVSRGQFIGLADNTGNSTGSHLHFQIERQPYWPKDNPYWSTALDMTFDDVSINGGRPRVNPWDGPYCREDDICDVFQASYVSGNSFMGDVTPPTGELSGISAGQVIETQTISLNGWAADDISGLDYGQLIANFDGSWHDLGPRFNPDFSYTWDLCEPGMAVNNGPVSLALMLYDKAGNAAPRVGLTNIIKDYSCPIPPTVCIPGADQVTLFEDPYYQGGCVKYSVGEYPIGSSLDPLGNDDADSILVGANVVATLYSDENFSGHSQAINKGTAYIQYGWVSANSLSSMKVSQRGQPPQTPKTVNPVPSAIFRSGDVIPFSWRNGGGATEYHFEIYLDSVLIRTFPWQSDPVLYVDSLGEGNYSWRVQGRNAAGTSAWSEKSVFSIESPIVFPPEETAPYSDTMESSESLWVRSNLWTYSTDPENARSGIASWWYQDSLGDYDNGQPNSGSLTSPPISIPSPGYYLRFYYRYQTETTGTTWDQRWVQISVDGGNFINLVQLADEPQMQETTSWLRSKAIDLSAYTGHIVRVRFQFSTLDASGNKYTGWGIDDFSISAVQPSTCSDNRQDETPVKAFLLAYDPNITVPGEICPNGDYDYYKFFGHAGDRIVADVDAMVMGSPLDAYLYLLDTDGSTVLAESDDEIYANLRDPLLSYTLTADGTYYLKLKAWKHPLVGGSNYDYTIRLFEDHLSPSLEVTWPTSNTYLPDTEMTLTSQVNDLPDGINRVDFFWHASDWLNGVWQQIGTDRDGSDGWSLVFNPVGQPEGSDGAIFAQVYDYGNNWAGSGVWNIGIDKTPPTTKMASLPGTQPSNAFLLSWTGEDYLSGIDYVEIQQKIGDASWTTLPAVDGSLSQYWIIGSPGSSYSYRMRGVDFSGNTEYYPQSAEATTAIPDANVLCYSVDSFDSSGDNDNSPDHASLIVANGAGQVHNFCNPLAPNLQNDEEWARLSVTTGQHIVIKSLATSSPAATQLSLYAEDGRTLLVQAAPTQFGSNSILVWTSDRDGDVYIRLQHVDGRVIGSDVGGTLLVKTGGWTFLPAVFRK